MPHRAPSARFVQPCSRPCRACWCGKPLPRQACGSFRFRGVPLIGRTARISSNAKGRRHSTASSRAGAETTRNVPPAGSPEASCPHGEDAGMPLPDAPAGCSSRMLQRPFQRPLARGDGMAELPLRFAPETGSMHPDLNDAVQEHSPLFLPEFMRRGVLKVRGRLFQPKRLAGTLFLQRPCASAYAFHARRPFAETRPQGFPGANALSPGPLFLTCFTSGHGLAPALHGAGAARPGTGFPRLSRKPAGPRRSARMRGAGSPMPLEQVPCPRTRAAPDAAPWQASQAISA